MSSCLAVDVGEFCFGGVGVWSRKGVVGLRALGCNKTIAEGSVSSDAWEGAVACKKFWSLVSVGVLLAVGPAVGFVSEVSKILVGFVVC